MSIPLERGKSGRLLQLIWNQSKEDNSPFFEEIIIIFNRGIMILLQNLQLGVLEFTLPLSYYD